MIIYKSTKQGFLNDVLAGDIENVVLNSFVRETGYRTSIREVRSWRNSMPYMSNVLNDPDIPNDAGIAIEYKIPQTSNRIDFIVTGLNNNKQNTAILIELKQWDSATITDMDGIVNTFVGGSNRNVNHPSHQVWSYAALLEDFNSAVEDDHIEIKPCAYLHNYPEDNVIRNIFYKEYLDKAPLFLKTDALKLRNFIKTYVKYGDKNNTMYLIESGKIRPSKNLADSLSGMIMGNNEFILIDEQKVVYETALMLARKSSDGMKNVLIVDGGPGTGKSVVAINLLVELTNRKQTVQYVTKNSAPRLVYEAKLAGKMTKSRISNLFRSSGSYYSVEPNSIDSLVVDEAHRLNKMSGLYSNKGENQIKELINAASFTVFFIDEDQRISISDIGEKEEIRRWAKELGASVTDLELKSQFRCNGSDAYLAWLDYVLQVRETAQTDLDNLDYDIQVCNSPEELRKIIVEKNEVNNKSRIVAGYCWPWVSAKDPSLYDITIGDFKAKWNLKSDGQLWMIKKDSVSEIGCIHTCQGLELDYIGVIIGDDFVIRNGRVCADGLKRASSDRSVGGIRTMAKQDPVRAEKLADMIIKNTYRTLMTRGQKGCYIYCVDSETQEYFRKMIEKDYNTCSKVVDYSDILE